MRFLLFLSFDERQEAGTARFTFCAVCSLRVFGDLQCRQPAACRCLREGYRSYWTFSTARRTFTIGEMKPLFVFSHSVEPRSLNMSRRLSPFWPKSNLSWPRTMSSAPSPTRAGSSALHTRPAYSYCRSSVLSTVRCQIYFVDGRRSLTLCAIRRELQCNVTAQSVL